MEPKMIKLPGAIEMAGRFAHVFGQLKLMEEKEFYDALLENAGKQVCDREIVWMLTMALPKLKEKRVNMTEHIDVMVGEKYISHEVVLSAKKIFEGIAKRMAN